MAGASDGKREALWFCGLWYVIDQCTPLANSFLVAAGLQGVVVAALWMFGHARARLGRRALLLLAAVCAYFAFYLWIVPGPFAMKLVGVLGMGLPLVMLGGGARLAHDRFDWPYPTRAMVGIAGHGVSFVLFLLLLWNECGLWLAGVVGYFWALSIVVLLYLGWELGAPPVMPGVDAHLGSTADFAARGMSHDR